MALNVVLLKLLHERAVDVLLLEVLLVDLLGDVVENVKEHETDADGDAHESEIRSKLDVVSFLLLMEGGKKADGAVGLVMLSENSLVDDEKSTRNNNVVDVARNEAEEGDEEEDVQLLGIVEEAATSHDGELENVQKTKENTNVPLGNSSIENVVKIRHVQICALECRSKNEKSLTKEGNYFGFFFFNRFFSK